MNVSCQKKGTMQTIFHLSRPFPIPLLFLFCLWQLPRVFRCLPWIILVAEPPPSVIPNVPQGGFALSLPFQGVFRTSGPVISIIRLSLQTMKVFATCLSTFFLLSFILFAWSCLQWGQSTASVLLLYCCSLAYLPRTLALKTGRGGVTSSVALDFRVFRLQDGNTRIAWPCHDWIIKCLMHINYSIDFKANIFSWKVGTERRDFSGL